MKIKKVLFCFCALLFVRANQSINQVYAQDRMNLDFESEQNTKFIYCNNPENVTKLDLADTTYNDKPTLLMKQAIKAGNYNLFISLRNMINKIDVQKKDQEKLYVDAQFCNNGKENLVIKVDKLGYQVPQSAMQLEPVSRYRNDTSWSCINAYSDYFQKKFNASDFIHDGKYDFITHVPKPLPDIYNDNIIIKPGESFWLLGNSQNERPGMLAGQVFLLLNDFKVVSGSGDVKIAAFVDIDKYSENASDGNFVTEIRNGVKSYRFYKGVANSSTLMQTNLEYDVDDNTDSNVYLPVEIKNSFTNDKYEVTGNWITNLNPWMGNNLAKKISESDMFKFQYSDNAATWYFDTLHNDYPNTLVGDEKTSCCNLGNWGVTNRYNITINNNSKSEQRLEYYIKSGSEFIVTSGDEVKIRTHIDTKENLPDELVRYYNNDINEYKKFLAEKKIPFSFSSEKDLPQSKVLEFVIPSKASKTISFDVTLCTNCDGGPQNYLRLIKQEAPVVEKSEIKNIKLNNVRHRIGFAQDLKVEVNGFLPTDSVVKAIVYKKEEAKETEMISAVSDKCDGVESFKTISFSSYYLNKLDVGKYGIKVQILGTDNNILAERNFDNLYEVGKNIVISSLQAENLNSLAITPDDYISKLNMHAKINGLQKNEKVISAQSYFINCDSPEKTISATEIKVDSDKQDYFWDLNLPRNLAVGNYKLVCEFSIAGDLNSCAVYAHDLKFLVCPSIEVPTVNLNQQNYSDLQYLRFESKGQKDIYYKLNDGDWTLYKKPIKLSYGETNIKAFCTDNDYYTGARSQQLQKKYFIGN